MRTFVNACLQVAVFLAIAGSAAAQERGKKGWNIGPLPAVGYNSDLGVQYGALCDIYYFGDGSSYPAYLHKFNVEVSRYTKGSGIYHFFHDARNAVPGVRSTVDISYLTDRLMDFHGFNGYHSAYDEGLGASYYKMDRRLFRFTIDLQGRLSGRFSWAAGVGYYHHTTGAVTLAKYRGAASLFDEYARAGAIRADELSGGRLEVKGGIVHDSRDNEADPRRGLRSELILLLSPGNGSYAKVFASTVGFLPLTGDWLTFAYRAAYQGTIAGEQPFYMIQQISTLYFRQISSEGLGGQNTLRGVARNRVTGAGVAWGNAEVRCRFAHFAWLGQEWYAVVNPFLDAGRVVQYYRRGEMMEADKEGLHASAGAGVKLVMNRNFVVSGEWGKPFDARDGEGGAYIGLNFIF
jgi:outer membrane protein assembly factor BamA